jgi:hypothetical protein
VEKKDYLLSTYALVYINTFATVTAMCITHKPGRDFDLLPYQLVYSENYHETLFCKQKGVKKRPRTVSENSQREKAERRIRKRSKEENPVKRSNPHHPAQRVARYLPYPPSRMKGKRVHEAKLLLPCLSYLCHSFVARVVAGVLLEVVRGCLREQVQSPMFSRPQDTIQTMNYLQGSGGRIKETRQGYWVTL